MDIEVREDIDFRKGQRHPRDFLAGSLRKEYNNFFFLKKKERTTCAGI